MTSFLGFLGREEFCEEFCSFFPSVLFLFCAHTFCELILSLAPPNSWEVGAKELWEAGVGRGTVWAGCKGKAGWLQCCQDLWV